MAIVINNPFTQGAGTPTPQLPTLGAAIPTAPGTPPTATPPPAMPVSGEGGTNFKADAGTYQNTVAARNSGTITPAAPTTPTTGKGAPTGKGTGAKTDYWTPYREMAAKAGADWNTVVNVYMNPNRRGTSDPVKAIGNYLADAQWRNLFVQFNGREPNELEWNEHALWRMSNGHARDPLLEPGHPQALQAWNDLVNQQNEQANSFKGTPPPEANWALGMPQSGGGGSPLPPTPADLTQPGAAPSGAGPTPTGSPPVAGYDQSQFYDMNQYTPDANTPPVDTQQYGQPR